MPPNSWVLSKVKRGAPSTGACPIVLINIPKRQAISPLTGEPLTKVDTVLSENNATAKYSGMLNLIATLARAGDINTNPNQLINVPKKLAAMPTEIARPASPLRAMG